MKLIVGLGNPGNDYTLTRHNVGFMALDTLKAAFEFPEFTENKKLHGAACKGKIDKNITVLLKPHTFMNESGLSVVAALNFYKLEPKDLVVIHDDKDIPLGETRIQSGRGDAGHNGVKSIVEQLGTKDFIRLRIGIAPLDRVIVNTGDFVLHKFSPEELSALRPVFKTVLAEVEQAVHQ